MSSTIEQLI